MKATRLLSLLKWPAALLLLGGLLWGAYFVHELMKAERAEEGETVKVPRRADDRVVKLGPELTRSHGIKDEPARAVSWTRRVTVYGRVVPNPQATTEIRAPFAGVLRAASPDVPWPAPGQWVRAG